MSGVSAPLAGKEAFLAEIAARLGRPRVTMTPLRPWAELPAEAVAPSTWVTRFESELNLLGASFARASSLPEAHRLIREELSRWNATRLISWARSELSSFRIDWLWDELGCIAFDPAASHDSAISDSKAFRKLALAAEIGITGVDFALASTGTLALSASPSRPRSVSLLPAVHVALARSSQLVFRMGDALKTYYPADRSPTKAPSAVHFISGPSRTSDIENDHTIGVHGPAAVSVILWEDRAPNPGGNPAGGGPGNSNGSGTRGTGASP